MSYERKVGRELSRRYGTIHSGQWIEFLDANGRGFAQPDHFLILDDRIICFECKLSQRDTGILQLGELYRPLLRKIFEKPVVGVMVCKVLRKECKWLIEDPSQAFNGQSGDIFTWHWIG